VKKLVGIVALLAAATALPCSAADKDISGSWSGQIVFRANSQLHPIGLNLKADGAKLTGTFCMNRCGSPNADIAIQNGKIDGDTISFHVALDAPDLPSMDVQGTAKGDTITLAVTNAPECGGSSCQIGEGSATRTK
jgi:hypothetical protein